VASLPSGTPPAVIGDNGNKVTVNFAEGVTDMPAGAENFLADIVKRMKSDSTLRLQLKGYAGSNSGPPSQARRVSLFRALSVRTYLMKQGVRSTRVDVRALGAKNDGEGRSDRVDVVFKK
jgi:outer membrane protein OmpA-like peptidoglycan-associated protein